MCLLDEIQLQLLLELLHRLLDLLLPQLGQLVLLKFRGVRFLVFFFISGTVGAMIIKDLKVERENVTILPDDFKFLYYLKMQV